MKRDPTETEAAILNSALKEISRKGYADATVRQIAQNAKVTALTVFRHFSDKETLFAHVIDAHSRITVDAEAIEERLSYSDLASDLEVLALAYFKTMYRHLDILRIHINEAYRHSVFKKNAWFISPDLREHFEAYLHKAGRGNGNRPELSEMFIAHITRRVLEYNIHDSIWSSSPEVEADFLYNIQPQLHWFNEVLTTH